VKIVSTLTNYNFLKKDDNHIPKLFVFFILLICVLPFLLSLFGVSFSSQAMMMDYSWAQEAEKHDAIDATFHSLQGAFTHTLMINPSLI